jgi:hypothetical protein
MNIPLKMCNADDRGMPEIAVSLARKADCEYRPAFQRIAVATTREDGTEFLVANIRVRIVRTSVFVTYRTVPPFNSSANFITCRRPA